MGPGCAGKWAPRMAVILGVALVTTSLLLPLSVSPGVTSDLAFLAVISSPFWMPTACLSWWALADIQHEVSGFLGAPPRRRRCLVSAAFVLVSNCGLLW